MQRWEKVTSSGEIFKKKDLPQFAVPRVRGIFDALGGGKKIALASWVKRMR